MTRMIKSSGLMLATGLATLVLMQPAMALDAQAFVDRIASVYKVMGYDMTFGAATLDGDTVTVDGLKVNVAGMEGDGYSFDTELTFTGVTENEDGSYSADELTVPDIDTDFSEDPVGHLTLVDMVANDLWIPPEGDTSALSMLQMFGSFSTGALTVTRDGAPVISFDGMEASNEFTFDDADALSQVDTSFTLNNIKADLSTVGEEEPEAGAVITALGLTNLSGNVSQTMSWTMADGHIVIDNFLADFADVGKIAFAADMSGFTPAMLDKLYAMQSSGIDPTTDEGQAKQMMAGMEIAQALTLTSLSLRYDDASLAGKLLDMFAAQSGSDRASFVAGLKSMLPMLIKQGGVPELADVVVPPVSTFLDDPKNIEIAVKPATPTSVLVLAAAASNPASLIQALGLAVTANQ